jgi:hypothetical protein
MAYQEKILVALMLAYVSTAFLTWIFNDCVRRSTSPSKRAPCPKQQSRQENSGILEENQTPFADVERRFHSRFGRTQLAAALVYGRLRATCEADALEVIRLILSCTHVRL